MRLPVMCLRGGTVVLTAGAVVAAVASGSSMNVQAQSWTPPYPMILTPDRALAFVQAADRNLDYVPGEVIVRFRDGVTVAGEQRALLALRSRPDVAQLLWITDKVAVLRDPEPDATILAAQLSTQPEVAYAEPNYLYHLNAVPTDPSFSSRQWNFTALDLPRAWDINPGANTNTIVAIVDTGITVVNQSFVFPTWTGRAIQNISVPFAINPDLAGSRLVSPRDFIFWNGPVFDTVGHGTHISGTISEDTNNNLAEAGIAYNARIMPVKVCLGFWEIQFILSSNGFRGYAPLDSGGCDDVSVAQGIRYAADNGATVINLSLGGSEPSFIIQDSLNYAVGKGAFISTAVGNEFNDGNPVEYPAAYAANLDGAMSVAAVGRSLVRAYYSNTGPHVEISAPGGDNRDGGAAGLIWQATISQSDSNPATVIFPRFDRYAETPFGGTSMATAHVSGIGALIISQGVTNPAAVEALIKKTARDLGSTGRDNEYGSGLIQPRTALFGFGIAK